MTRPTTPKSLLFVPANRPERFDKAQKSGSDAIVIDLEDTVAINEKPTARLHITSYNQSKPKPFWVRINNHPNNAQLLTDDLACLCDCQYLAGVILPKLTQASTIDLVHDRLDCPIIGVIETTQGLHNLPALANGTGLIALSFGLLDLGNELGVTHHTVAAERLFDNIRSQLVVYSSLNQLARPIETICTKIDDRALLIKQAMNAYHMGFGGQLCIHPKQVALINQLYQPPAATTAFAQEILSHYENTGEFAFVINGTMVDLPLIEWAAHILGKPNPISSQ